MLDGGSLPPDRRGDLGAKSLAKTCNCKLQPNHQSYHLLNTNEKLGELGTVISPFAELVRSLLFATQRTEGVLSLMTACDCDDLGSSSPVCDVMTGQCACQVNVARASETTRSNTSADTRCSLCKAEYYGLASGQGCAPCNCDADGSSSMQCSESGVCPCKQTIVGIKCTHCAPGYFLFSASGCM